MKKYLERLKELRKSNRLSQQELAEILDTTNSSICDWECGRSQPDIETLIKIAEYSDVSVNYLLRLCD